MLQKIRKFELCIPEFDEKLGCELLGCGLRCDTPFSLGEVVVHGLFVRAPLCSKIYRKSDGVPKRKEKEVRWPRFAARAGIEPRNSPSYGGMSPSSLLADTGKL